MKHLFFKSISTVVFFCFLNVSSLSANDTLRVLFVGNSFTYFYNLPQVVTSMAATQGRVIYTKQSTVGGSNLEDHWLGRKGAKTKQIIAEGNWDYVVFNNHSRSSIDTPKRFMEYGGLFAGFVRKNNGEPIFMMTWAYKSAPRMQTTITEMHERLADETNSWCVPAGSIFAEIRKCKPTFDLFFDDKHPSYSGTYLLGLCFYKFFTNKKTTSIPTRLTTKDSNGEKLYLMFMHREDADFLKEIVDDFSFETIANKN